MSLDDAFSEIFKLEASPVEGQSLQQKDKKRRKRKGGDEKARKRHTSKGKMLPRDRISCLLDPGRTKQRWLLLFKT